MYHKINCKPKLGHKDQEEMCRLLSKNWKFDEPRGRQFVY